MSGRSLAELAQDAGYAAADVAVLSGLDQSTVSRLWRADDWLDRISGRSLQALLGVLPDLLGVVETAAANKRADALAGDLAAAGVEVDSAAAEALRAEGIASEHLGAALQAAALIMRGDSGLAARHLTRCFGREQDTALGHLFTGGLVQDPAPLLAAATGLADELRGRADESFHAFIGYATVAHHTARVTGAPLADGGVRGARQAAFLNRSTTIGLLLATGDVDLVGRYARNLEGSAVAAMVEDWALPTYCRDVTARPDYWLPRSVVLARTGAEVLREVESYPAAYVAYLAGVYLPRALRRDPGLGGHRAAIRAALALRRDVDLDEPAVAEPVDRLLTLLPYRR